jgi:hypothetical protein
MQTMKPMIRLNIPLIRMEPVERHLQVGMVIRVSENSVNEKCFAGDYNVVRAEGDTYYATRVYGSVLIRITVRPSGLAIISSNSDPSVPTADIIDLTRTLVNSDGVWHRVQTSGCRIVVNALLRSLTPPPEGGYLSSDFRCYNLVGKVVDAVTGEVDHHGVEFKIIADTFTHKMTSVTIYDDVYGAFDIYPDCTEFVHALGKYRVIPTELVSIFKDVQA